MASSDSGPESQNGSINEMEKKENAVEPLRLPTVEEIRGQDIWNNCATRSVVSGVMGGGLGLVMGLFFGALDNPLRQEEMTGRQQLIFQAKQMGRRSVSSAKAFAVMGLIFSAVECVVEKVYYRGKGMINLNLSVVDSALSFVTAILNLKQAKYKTLKTFNPEIGNPKILFEIAIEKRQQFISNTGCYSTRTGAMARAKHDMTNIVAAGCATGGALSAKAGPRAACAGCAGFAAFSVVIEKFLGHN